MRIFGFDIGTTSIGFAVIDHDPEAETGRIHRLGVRIFPEARDPKGTPLNQTRRQKRMLRRQLRRRRQRRRALNEALTAAGLLPPFGSPHWRTLMETTDPYTLRDRGLDAALAPHQLGRALYHLAQRRHFRGRDLEDEAEQGAETPETETAEDKAARTGRDATTAALKASGATLGRLLARLPDGTRKRGIHALRRDVEAEFDRLWAVQAQHHPALDQNLRAQLTEIAFAQRPVFWRLSTLGRCALLPDRTPCPKASWASQQRRMLEKLNNLALAGGNGRPLEADERAAILAKLQTQAGMSWGGVRGALAPLFKARGEPGAHRSLKFNLELTGDGKLPGNPLEARLAEIFGDTWADHPQRDVIRTTVPQRLWAADYGSIGSQRVIVRPEAERRALRAAAAADFAAEFGATGEQAAALAALPLAMGWDAFSADALDALLPHLDAGVRMGELLNGPRWAAWRDTHFPDRQQTVAAALDRLPSPADKAERARLAGIRNPTVVRTQNELRKVVNNLLALYGRPDRIRVEVARDVGRSKRERDDDLSRSRSRERERKAAARDLTSKGIEPDRATIEKWLLWKESRERCPYTGDQICFDALFREGRFEVEHIWPRSRCFDDGFRNKTLCRRDVNIAKGNRTPHEHFGNDPAGWDAVRTCLNGLMAAKGGTGMPPGKVRRFLAESIPEDFTGRQLADTGYAARQILAALKRLWPDEGPTTPVRVEAVSGRVTGQLRRLWGLNNILSDDGEKTRADHRHHAVDALAVACTHPGMTNRLSRYWQQKENPRATAPDLPPPWAGIRAEAEAAVAGIVVSHRVRRKLSGPLHAETVYGDTGEDVTTKSGRYRQFVARKPVTQLTPAVLAADPAESGEGIRDPQVRATLTGWVGAQGGDPKKAFETLPRLGPDGPPIRRVRLLTKQQVGLMAPVSTGYADLGANHHIVIWQAVDGAVSFEVVSLYEAAKRRARRQPAVRRTHPEGARFVMSLAPGEAVQIPGGPRQGVWIVTGVWAAGPIILERANDAAHATTFRPNAASLLRDGARKVAIDPIGRIRPAGD